MKKLLPLLITLSLGSTSALADNLAEIYNLAKENDPSLLRSAAQKDAAFEAIEASRSALLPKINLNASYDINRSEPASASSENNTLAAGINFSQQLYQRTSWINLAQSEKAARQADAAYAAEQQNLILRVATAYFEVLRAQDSLDFVRAEKAAVSRQLEQTKQRFEVGLSAITDVHDAQAQYDSVLASEIISENALINSYEALREITGQEHKDLSQLHTKRFSATRLSETPQNLIDQAQTENLSLLSARIAKDIAKENISLADASKLPTLTLDGGYNYSDRGHSTADYDIDAFNVGLNFSMPLYTGGNITAQVKQAEYNFIAASESLEASFRSVVTNVRSSYNNVNASIGTIKAYEQSVISAQSALEATEAGFDVGTRTIVDVLDSTRNLYNANRNLANARYDYIISILNLRQAVGTLSEQDILDINDGLK